MRNGNRTERALKQLESEIVFLEQQQTELLRRKWALEERNRKQQQRIEELEQRTEKEQKGHSFWKKTALILAAFWAIVVSVLGMGDEKK
jgi:predicted unusual protein kinase regulating ubiquinone biosynthesis (AarF/ABC1/UbiB family)